MVADFVLEDRVEWVVFERRRGSQGSKDGRCSDGDGDDRTRGRDCEDGALRDEEGGEDLDAFALGRLCMLGWPGGGSGAERGQSRWFGFGRGAKE